MSEPCRAYFFRLNLLQSSHIERFDLYNRPFYWNRAETRIRTFYTTIRHMKPYLKLYRNLPVVLNPSRPSLLKLTGPGFCSRLVSWLSNHSPAFCWITRLEWQFWHSQMPIAGIHSQHCFSSLRHTSRSQPRHVAKLSEIENRIRIQWNLYDSISTHGTSFPKLFCSMTRYCHRPSTVPSDIDSRRFDYSYPNEEEFIAQFGHLKFCWSVDQHLTAFCCTIFNMCQNWDCHR